MNDSTSHTLITIKCWWKVSEKIEEEYKRNSVKEWDKLWLNSDGNQFHSQRRSKIKALRYNTAESIVRSVSLEEFVFMCMLCAPVSVSENSIYLTSEQPIKLIIPFNVFHARAVDAFSVFDIVINCVRDICGSIET